MNKIVLSAQDLLEDSFRLGLKVLEDGYRPTMIIAIWRGGAPRNFKLKMTFWQDGNNSGIQYRSRELPDHLMTIQVAPDDCTGCGVCVVSSAPPPLRSSSRSFRWGLPWRTKRRS